MDQRRLASTRILVAALVCALVISAAPAASARTAVRDRLHQRTIVARQLVRLRANVRDHLRRFEGKIASARTTLRSGRLRQFSTSIVSDMLHDQRWERSATRRVRRLLRRKRTLNSWLARNGVFTVCPVPAYSVIHDDFGEIVDVPKVPRHAHMGNDIEAPPGATIRAPFDGVAFASTSPLGGLQVTVEGPRGAAFNAHLSAYGRLGTVHAGDVIGYVGSTGDSTAPHDHFEWHPGGGVSVDPHALLVAACVELPGRR